jgi:hypothetical protein
VSLDWGSERYVRLYVRDTGDWSAMSWQAQSLFCLMLRKADRTGFVATTKGGRGIAALVRMPLDVTEPALKELVDDGCIQVTDGGFLFPNFIEAQEATSSPAARQRESRERRRDMLRAGLDPHQRDVVVYFIQSEHGGPIKIGYAEDLGKRLVQLQTSRPDKLVVLATAKVSSLKDERRVHSLFSSCREKGEWFSHSPRLGAFIKRVADGASLAELVTEFEASHETGHESQPVTLYRSVPDRTEQIEPKTAPLVLVGPPEPKPRKQPTGPHAEVVDCFNDHYRQAYGSGATWGDKQGAMVKGLLASHSVDKIRRHIANLFERPPAHLKPPFDLGTLVSNFDKLADAPRAVGFVDRKKPMT